MILHDTHFHLDLIENPLQVAEQIDQARIYTIAVTNLPDVFDYTFNLSRNHKYIRAALGFHPELAAVNKNQLKQFMEKVNLTRYIGEIGLDNCNKSHFDFFEQKNVFEKIISRCAELRNKILTVHSRRAEKEVLSIIGSKFPGKVILHWYSGNLKFGNSCIVWILFFG